MKKQKRHTCIVCRNDQYKVFTYQGHDYCECKVCGLISTYPYHTDKEILHHYKEKFEKGNYGLSLKYMKEYGVIYRYFVDVLKKKVGQYNDTLKKKKVLDVGCFTGEFLTYMQQQGSDVLGLELQEDAVKIANKKLHGKVLRADVMKDTFPREKFDIITLLGLVEHVTNPIKLIERSKDLLKKGGILLIQTPNSSSLIAKATRQYWPPYSPIEHVHLFSRGSLEQTLQRLGFEDIEFIPHWKRLPVVYVYHQLKNFGPEFYKLLKPLEKIISKMRGISLPFYVGEMIMVARKA